MLSLLKLFRPAVVSLLRLQASRLIAGTTPQQPLQSQSPPQTQPQIPSAPTPQPQSPPQERYGRRRQGPEKVLVSQQILACSDSPIKLLEFYSAKKGLLKSVEKLSILELIANLMYAMYNSTVSSKHGYRYWHKIVWKQKEFTNLLDTLQSDLKERPWSFKPDEVAVFYWSLTKLKIRRPSIYAGLHKWYLNSLSKLRLPIESLSMLVWSYSECHLRDPDFLAFLHESVYDKAKTIDMCESKDFLHYSIIMTAFYRINPGMHAILCNDMLRRLVARSGKVSTGVLSNLICNVATMNTCGEQEKAMEEIVRELTKRRAGEFSMHNLFMICRAMHLAKSRFVTEDLARFVMNTLKRNFKFDAEKGIKTRNAKTYIEALVLFLGPQQFSVSTMKHLKLFLNILKDKIELMNHRDCVVAMWALCKLYGKMHGDEKLSSRIKQLIMDASRKSARLMKTIDVKGAYGIAASMRAVKLHNTDLDTALKAKNIPL